MGCRDAYRYSIGYLVGQSGQRLEFSPQVLAHFAINRQTRFWQREAGGQLFARFSDEGVHVVEATGPRPTDRRSRLRYEPDRRAEQNEIDVRFPQGLHFVGDWHTHPEVMPTPSDVDVQSTSDGVRRSSHCLHAFVMVIVGRGSFPESLYVSVNDGGSQHVLMPESSL